ncbi:MAG: aminotransferase class III-fold pyridoxal phosphate-dependent enzyme [Spirochaetaceae bacterium]|nr:aminotransferase class III-fold pyridoxal phosphate-dependent enzyme [Spirochaetaceae bacterium]
MLAVVVESVPGRGFGVILNGISVYHEVVVGEMIRSYDASARRLARARQVLAGGVSSSFRAQVTPVLSFERGAGPYLYDADGHELLDYTLAWGLLIAGSCHPHINAAVRGQLERGYAVGAGHELEIRLAERLVAVLPGVDLVTFASTGSEIVQVALRLARAATGRDKILKFEGHYHGWMNNVLVSHHPDAAHVGARRPVPALTAGQPSAEYADTLVAPWNDLDALRAVFAVHGEQIAGVISEPLLANSGCCEPRPGYLAGMLETAHAHGALVIFDEVITGFRLALGGAREHYGLTPDLSVYAKAVAGGFPLAAVAGSTAAFAPLLDGRTVHSGSNNGSPVAVAAALATLEVLSEPGTFDAMHAHGHAIRRHLEQEARRFGIALVTCGAGSVFSTHFGLREPPRCYADTLAADHAALARFRAVLLDESIYLLPDGRWYVGATHTDRELQRALPAVTTALRAIA